MAALSHITELWLDRIRADRLAATAVDGRRANDKPQRSLFTEGAASAAVDVVIRERLMPRWWPDDTKAYVLKQLRAGTHPRMLSRMTRLDVGPLERIARGVRASSVAELLRNDSWLAAA